MSSLVGSYKGRGLPRVTVAYGKEEKSFFLSFSCASIQIVLRSHKYQSCTDNFVYYLIHTALHCEHDLKCGKAQICSKMLRNINPVHYHLGY